jgi:hypothetical protein
MAKTQGNQIEAATVSMLKQRDGDPEVAEIEFNRVQQVDQFHKDFDGLDST